MTSCAHRFRPPTQELVSRHTAGNGSERGGGDALFCDGGLFGKKYYLADTYGIFNSNKKNIFKMLENSIPDEHKRDFIFELLSLGVGKEREFFFKRVRGIAEQFKIIEQDEIEDIDDDQIILPKDCSKKEQLAVHEIGSFQIRVKKSIYQQLTATEKEFLLAHEVFIYAYYTWGYNLFDPNMKPAEPSEKQVFDTSNIRDFLARLVDGPQFTNWMKLFSSFHSMPGLRLHELLIKVKFTDLEKVQDTKSFCTESRAALLNFASVIKFQIITAKEIWMVHDREVKNFSDGWSQTYAAILNNEKDQNLGVIEFTCHTPYFDTRSRGFGTNRITLLDREKLPVEIGRCYLNLLL
ncbi:MAG: hypothetical protein IPK04_01225 [Bdellovibrionales bacterium]|nr:hypothetical protein [Bdellovibrionales bacterium]